MTYNPEQVTHIAKEGSWPECSAACFAFADLLARVEAAHGLDGSAIVKALRERSNPEDPDQLDHEAANKLESLSAKLAEAEASDAESIRMYHSCRDRLAERNEKLAKCNETIRKFGTLQEELFQRAEKAEAEAARLRERLEIVHATDGDGNRVPFPEGGPDGIECRDETIRLLEAEVARLKAHAEAMANCCEALEKALTKAASIYADRVTLNIDDFLPLTKAYLAYRRDYPKGAK